MVLKELLNFFDFIIVFLCLADLQAVFQVLLIAFVQKLLPKIRVLFGLFKTHLSTEFV